MELSRRLGAGRLAEMFGPVAVSSGPSLKRVGSGSLARPRPSSSAWRPRAAKLLDAYAVGVEAYRGMRPPGQRSAPEFRAPLDFDHGAVDAPEDSLVIGKWMSLPPLLERARSSSCAAELDGRRRASRRPIVLTGTSEPPDGGGERPPS